MARQTENETRVIGCRMTDAEIAEVDAYLQRAGVGRSDFMRNALLAKVRGATAFAEMLPAIAESLDRQIADLAKMTAEVRTLAAASVASSALLLDDGTAAEDVAARTVDDGIERALLGAERVVALLADRR